LGEFKVRRRNHDSILARLLDVTMNNNAIPDDWKKAIVVLIFKEEGRSVAVNYRPLSLTSLLCKQMEHVFAGYLTQVCEMSGWLYEGQQAFRLGSFCESPVVTVCQEISHSLDEGVTTDAIIINFSKAFELVPHEKLLTKIAVAGVDLRVVVWVKTKIMDSVTLIIYRRT
jgi:hypothetical protein